MSQYSREPWYYKFMMRYCKTDRQKRVVALLVRERKGLLMGLGFLFICGTFPRLLSVQWNEDRYFAVNRYRKRQEEDLQKKKLDEKSEK